MGNGNGTSERPQRQQMRSSGREPEHWIFGSLGVTAFKTFPRNRARTGPSGYGSHAHLAALGTLRICTLIHVTVGGEVRTAVLSTRRSSARLSAALPTAP